MYKKTFKEVLSESVQKEMKPIESKRKIGFSSSLISNRLGVSTMLPTLGINHSFITEKRTLPTYTVEAWDRQKYRYELVFSTSNEMEIKDASPYDYSTNKIVVKTWIEKKIVHVREVELSTIF